MATLTAPEQQAPSRAKSRIRLAPLRGACALTALLLAEGCAPTGTIQGVVVDQSGKGAAAVTVTLAGPAAAETRTDARGRYAFRRLAAGAYSVALRNPPAVALPRPGKRSLSVEGRARAEADFALLSAGLTRISDIQGRGHLSPLSGRAVASVVGIVTALRAPVGFFVQSPLPDSSPDTSEGLFVAVSRMPEVAAGDLVLLDGSVEEHYAAGCESGDLPVTRLVLAGLKRLARGFETPEPVVLGEGGRRPPDRVICNDAGGNAESSPFDPAEDGLDFYESLEGMLVQVNEPLVVAGSRGARGEFQVVGDGGRGATTLTPRGGLALLAGDSNPERITVTLKGEPDVAQQQAQSPVVGDRYPSPITGPLDYSRGEYKILPLHPLPQPTRAGLPRQIASLRADERTFTCAELSARPSAAGVSRENAADLAETIVTALHSPHLVALIGMRDEAGQPAVRALLGAIRAAGGPATYRWRDLAQANGTSIGFLYDRERVQLVERMGDSARSPVLVREAAARPELSWSPGLVGLDDPAFGDSPRPLAAEFLFRGRRLFVIAARFASRQGDAPPFGRIQPSRPAGDAQRMEQAKALNRFVSAILSRDRDADVVVLGDFSDPAHSASMAALRGRLLFDLAEQRLSPEERYTRVWQGSSVDFDHVLVSANLLDRADARIEIVHRYAEYDPESGASDHDPLLAAFRLR